jgi:ABC-type nitrate/sulfonate/bicarbonate transport system permease component
MTKCPAPARRLAIRLFPIVVVLVGWELSGRFALYDIKFVPVPSLIFGAVAQMAWEGLLWWDVSLTAIRITIGCIVGTSLGFAMGLLTGLVPRARSMIEPLVQMARPIPAVALIPLAIVYFGVGEFAKIFIVGWASFFPVWVNTHLGVQRVPEEFLWTAAVLGADDRMTLTQVIVPCALPFIHAGLRVALGLAFAATVVAEMSGASAGLGYRIFTSHSFHRYDRMIGAIMLVGTFGAAVDWLFMSVTHKLFPWLSPETT